jgi:hypothetical protein
MHWHNHMQELVVAYRLDHAGRVRRGRFQGHIRGADHIQGFDLLS